MTFPLLLRSLLIAGLIIAPFAGWPIRRSWSHLSRVILLLATLAVVGCFAYALDRGRMPPLSAIYWGSALLVGVGLCARVFRRDQAGIGLVCGVVFVGVGLALHFFSVDLARTCQRAYVSVRPGMTPDEVKSIILREFAKCPNYHVAVSGSAQVGREGYVQFDVRPDYINLKGAYLQVDFFYGSARGARVTLSNSWFKWWDLAGGIIVLMLCWWQFSRSAHFEGVVMRKDLATAMERLRRIRSQGDRRYAWQAFLSGRQKFIRSAGARIQRLAYFRYLTTKFKPRPEGADYTERRPGV